MKIERYINWSFWQKNFIFIFTTLSLASCETPKKTAPGQVITIMTYNVENLFDNFDDPGKKDETYLPIQVKKKLSHKKKCLQLSNKYYKTQCLSKDWSDTKIHQKMVRIADVVKQVKNGKGPDLLFLQEVENFSVVEKLRLDHLEFAGYKPAVLIEGPDERGIDVAILTRLELSGKPQLHLIDLKKVASVAQKLKKNPKMKVRPTRGILEARFQLPGGKYLTTFAVHFPSQGSPTPFREQAIQRLNGLKNKLPLSEYVIAAGDFNITAKEDQKSALFKDKLAANWLISHFIGCQSCKGTHNYKGHWSFLDAILFSKNFIDSSWKLDKKSIYVAKSSPYQKNSFAGPERFNDGRGSRGVSDHFPIVAEIFQTGED